MKLLNKWNPVSRANELDPWIPTTRWDPMREMEEWMRGLHRVFPTGSERSGEPLRGNQWYPSVDIGENDQEFVVKAELPEVKKEDIKVTIENGILTITGERKVEKEETNMRFHRLERSFGSFERSFSLPDAVMADKITSDYKDGILTVHVPKNPSAKAAPHLIPVS